MENFRLKTITALLLTTLFIESCCFNGENTQKKEILYHDNGAVKSEVEIKNGQKNGIEKIYTTDNKLLCRRKWKDNVEHGLYEEYKPFDGSLSKIGSFMKGKKYRCFIEFYQENQPYAIKNYVVLEDRAELYQKITLDPFGNIDKKKSFYCSVSLDKDTVVVGEYVRIDACLDAPHFPDGWMIVVLGNFDKKFNFDFNKTDTIKAIDWKAVIEKNFSSEGEHSIRGIISNCTLVNDSIIEAWFFFEKKVTVLPKPTE